MTWIKKIELSHDCNKELPGKHEADFGSIWQCDTCGKRYILYNISMRGSNFPAWHPYKEDNLWPLYKEENIK